ncbi:DUF1294 domain-containing protein [Pseudoalteromonas sp. McH1-7]|uniref:DUF1294 domain-containing protein n=1 Tax=Pseudoalteromonas peptidolytica F12-50-A1 TaxID=1315280 RepID=A0A8I0MYZ9_9GAMM|nr:MULTISPECIES: DUF1294 domain-containing protein [Pseudoalteromonas]MBE0348456.1 hypothetical protein [Pseudoalteromonas peptidolytica F12-50-A1]MDW7549199.1 DUF1294 domain-containing protein [Pseudoalteromonas peptidolytica]NLR15045.1 DUF1294 domain-containing protein [Pseudoalteromonas peptidolytica]NUZ09999.1 DUF1294 domain-containing protein [Pseudoalteromonas sp. McH1-7]RRS07949.1 DUF1294 domain-containing protein [Pseudoalteromonas sp. J010]
MSITRLVHHQLALFWGIAVWLGALCVSQLPWHVIFTIAILVFNNLCIFILFWWDKRSSTLAHSRVAEKNLLLAGLLGLNIATPIAMFVLKHKTIKPSFNFKLLAVLFFQSLVFGVLFVNLFILR